MLQFRPVGDAGWKETPFYSPSRDIAHNGIPFIAEALFWLDKSLDSDSEFRGWLERNGIGPEQIVAAAERLAGFFNRLNDEELAERLAEESGIFDTMDLAMQTVMAFIGRYMTLAIFTGMRDISNIPSSVKEFVSMIREVKEKLESKKSLASE